MKNVVAKFKCVEVSHLEHGKKITLQAVMGDSPENRAFNDYTPSGRIEVYIAPDKPAGEYFTAGEEYYVTLEKAPKL